MKTFLDSNFLLQSDTAQKLYHEHAAKMPIIDYHCHLIPQQIADNYQFADLTDKYVHQFALLFLDLQKKCDSAEISTKALDLRGMLDALRLMRRGVAAGPALDMGITNKAFDSYEQGLIRDVIAARIPAKLDAGKLFA